MKRLLNSSKFWLAVIGSIVAVLTWLLTKSEPFAMYVSGLFGFVIGGHTAKDIFIKKDGGERNK